jgi:kynurenine 3-monooxygenase
MYVYHVILTYFHVDRYFKTYFPDAIALMPSYIEEYTRNPACQLVTVRARPWNFKDSIVLIGDAAHAMVPFYGQVSVEA